MYPFMVNHLELDADGVFDVNTGKFDESKTTIESPDQMRVFGEDRPIPTNALKPGSKVPF